MVKKHILLVLSVITLFNCSSDDEIIEKSEEEDSEIIYTLPVVVHIIHTGEEIGIGYNLSNVRIIDQIKTLNNDFKRKEGTLGFNEHPLGADAKIDFKLAEFDPNGDLTSGINRVNIHDIVIDTDNDWFFDDLPFYGYWNKQDYINIWVFPFEPNRVLGQSSVPQTNLPGLENAKLNGTTGILITTPHFGTSEVVGGANLGRSLTHEMGHFLGLEHLWGKTENAYCLEFDDYCEDTPSVSKRTGNCDGVAPLTCIGENALTQNYMDYTNDACMNMFTKNQIARMRYVLKNSVVRKPLVIAASIHRD